MLSILLQDLKSPNILVDSQWRIKIGGECIDQWLEFPVWHSTIALETHLES